MTKKIIDINIIELMHMVWQRRRQYIIVCGAMSILGIIVAFSIPRIYKASVMLAPEEASSGAMGNISSLASMVGLDMKIGTSDAIYPEIYPDLISSTDFIVSMFQVKVKSSDGDINCNYYTYLHDKQKSPWWEWPMNFVRQTIKKMNADSSEATTKEADPFCLTKEQDGIAKTVNHAIECSVDKKTNVITIKTTAQDPLIAATLADSAKEKLQVFITNYRTQKARNDEAYMEKLFKEAHEQYIKARQQYASFSDSNQEAMLQSIRSKQEDLENEMQLKYNIYTQVAEQLQLTKAKVQERTPAFTVIQRATVPIKHANMPKIFILAIFIILGIAGETLWMMWCNKDYFLKANE